MSRRTAVAPLSPVVAYRQPAADRGAVLREQNVRWHGHSVTGDQRAAQKQQTPCVLWFTGLSGAGKSTLANAVDECLYRLGHHTFVLDGDNLRHGLSRDLGFSDGDRSESVRRAGEAARLLMDAGLIVIVASIAPFRRDRDAVRERIPHGRFIEIHVDAPLDLCEQRDPKGLYHKARIGEISNFTGIDSPYEVPISPEVVIDTRLQPLPACVETVMYGLQIRGLLGA
jgi:adenylyl-sulfate kinase